MTILRWLKALFVTPPKPAPAPLPRPAPGFRGWYISGNGEWVAVGWGRTPEEVWSTLQRVYSSARLVLPADITPRLPLRRPPSP